MSVFEGSAVRGQAHRLVPDCVGCGIPHSRKAHE